MDDNSLNSDYSVCSDDTEYLLGQNVSIREIDDFDLKASELNSLSAIPKYHRAVHVPHSTKTKHVDHSVQSLPQSPETRRQVVMQSRGKEQISLRHYDSKEYQSRGTIKAKTTSVLEHEYTSNTASKYPVYPPRVDMKTPSHRGQLEFTEEVTITGKERKRKQKEKTKQKQDVQEKESNAKFRMTFQEEESREEHFTKIRNKRKASPVRKPEKSHKDQYLSPTKDLVLNSRQKSKMDYHMSWHQRASPGNHDDFHVDSEDGYDGDNDMKYDSPERADVGSIASEATEELLNGDELDGSVMEKLKQLNLAVNFDPETEEFYDDKVQEGAELLSKLFGGSVDNYYSSPSGYSKSSGSPSGQEGSKGEVNLEEKTNISNTSSKGGSHIAGNLITQQTSSEKKPKRKGKVSFATDESSSFDSSYHISSKGQSSSSKQGIHFYGKSFEEESRYSKFDNHSDFVRETSALRAAMDYEDDDSEQDANSYGQERSPAMSSASQSRQYEEALPKYNSGYNRGFSQKPVLQNEEELHIGDAYSQETSQSRYKVEKYPENSHTNTHVTPEHERHIEGFLTSTPQRQQTASLIKITQSEKDELERKGLLEKKLKATEDKISQSVLDLRDIEFDIEEAATRKKMAFQEVQMLGETLKRAKADIKSSENLAEQYRQQATKTRSELMDLEVERDSAQQELKDLSSLLTRQKQETTEAIKVERKNERKVLELTLERDKLLREVETFKTRLEQSETTLNSEKDCYREKMAMLQAQLHDEQRSAKESIERLKQQLDYERQNARDSHYERINSIHKLQDEAKEIHEKELEALKVRMNREKELDIEKTHERAKREMELVTRKVQDGELRISQLENSLKDRQEEAERVKSKLLEEKQKVYDSEMTWKEALGKQEAYSKALKAEVDALKQREADTVEQTRTLEQNIDDKLLEMQRMDENSSNQAAEFHKTLENKEEEIRMLHSLVRQQEEATRHLGEKMRNEAQEHIRSALKKERDSMDKERARHKEKLDEMRDNYEDVLKQARADLEDGRTGQHQLQTTVTKMKRDMERLRQLHLQTQEEKVNAVSQLRSESKEQVMKLRERIEELTLLSDKEEKETVLEINEECRRVAALLGGSPNTTPMKASSLSSSFSVSILGESPGSTIGSPTRDALANLRSCNAELRQHLLEAKKELEQQKNSPLRKEQSNSADLSQQQISFFKKALKSKDDEIARLKRQLQEETNRGTAHVKSERVTYQRTIERLEKELKETQQLIPSSSPIVNGHSSPLDNTNTSGLGTSLSSTTASPRPGEDSSTARLLRHLQGRVKQLRAQNESLRSDSLNDSQTSVCSTADSADRENQEDSTYTKKLHTALQLSDQRAQKNAAILSQKMMEMTKLQKMLTHATKENMKLERAYASLQRKIIDTAR